MLKGNQRYNGMMPSVYSNKDDHSSSTDELKFIYTQNHDTGEREKIINQSNNLIPNGNQNSLFSTNLPLQTSAILQCIKKEPDQDFEQKIATHSIIGISQGSEYKTNKLHPTSKTRLKRNSSQSSYHESLQRIGGVDPYYNHYQQYWFSSSLERLKLEDKSREERLEITRYELQRHLKQIVESNLGKTDVYTEDTAMKPKCNVYVPQRLDLNAGYDRLVPSRFCDVEKCKRRSLPCTRYCALHIMQNADQVLFDYCTAKFADNTQCSVPVFDITHELPLCPEHARKRDNYRMYQETKPKKLRKKVKPSAMIRPQKRNKKKKRPTKPPDIVVPVKSVDEITPEEPCDVTPDLPGDMVQQVLSLQESDGLELVSVEQALVTQASNLLEESEINNVLSTIQADEFNDFFTVNRNGEYEPTREETEELERALAAVDNDVKSLEKLTQSQGLLDQFLDDHTLVESLVQIPDVFHNGYAPCGNNIVTQTSRLLSVEPHSQS